MLTVGSVGRVGRSVGRDPLGVIVIGNLRLQKDHPAKSWSGFQTWGMGRRPMNTSGPGWQARLVEVTNKAPLCAA